MLLPTKKQLAKWEYDRLMSASMFEVVVSVIVAVSAIMCASAAIVILGTGVREIVIPGVPTVAVVLFVLMGAATAGSLTRRVYALLIYRLDLTRQHNDVERKQGQT